MAWKTESLRNTMRFRVDKYEGAGEHLGKFFVSILAEAEGFVPKEGRPPVLYYHEADDVWRESTCDDAGKYAGFYDNELAAIAARHKAGGNKAEEARARAS